MARFLLSGGFWSPAFATSRPPVLPEFLGGERAQALVLLAAGGAARQVRCHPWDPLVGGCADQLELDVDVERLEALVAAELGRGRAQQAREGLIGGVLVHRPSFQPASIAKPRSASAARSRRRA